MLVNCYVVVVVAENWNTRCNNVEKRSYLLTAAELKKRGITRYDAEMLLAQGMNLPEPRVMLGQRVNSVITHPRHGTATDNNNDTQGMHTRSGSWPQPTTRTTRSAHKRCSLPERGTSARSVAEEITDMPCFNSEGRRLRTGCDTDSCDRKSAEVCHQSRTLETRVRASSPRAKQRRLDGIVEHIVSQNCSRRLPLRQCDDITGDTSSKTSVISHHRSKSPVSAHMTASPVDSSVVSPCSKINVTHDTVDFDGDMCTRGSDVDTQPVSSLDHACLTTHEKTEAMPCLKCELDNSLSSTIEYDDSAVDEMMVKSHETNGTLMPVLEKEDLPETLSQPCKYRKTCCSHIRKTKQRCSPNLHRLLGLNSNKVTSINHDRAAVYDFEPSLPDCKWADIAAKKMASNNTSEVTRGVPIQKVLKEARYHSKLIVHHGSKVPRLRIRMLVDSDDGNTHAVVNNCHSVQRDDGGCPSASPKRRFSRCSRTLQSTLPCEEDFTQTSPDGIRTKGPPLKRMRLKFGADSIDIPIPVGNSDSLGWC